MDKEKNERRITTREIKIDRKAILNRIEEEKEFVLWEKRPICSNRESKKGRDTICKCDRRKKSEERWRTGIRIEGTRESERRQEKWKMKNDRKSIIERRNRKKKYSNEKKYRSKKMSNKRIKKESKKSELELKSESIKKLIWKEWMMQSKIIKIWNKKIGKNR